MIISYSLIVVAVDLTIAETEPSNEERKFFRSLGNLEQENLQYSDQTAGN